MIERIECVEAVRELPNVLLRHPDRMIVPILIGKDLTAVSSKSLYDLRQIFIDGVQMNAMFLAEVNSLIQSSADTVCPKNDFCAIGLLRFELVDVFLDGRTNIGSSIFK